MFFILFKPIMLIPHLICLWALGIASMFVMFVAWWAVIITGKYPEPLWQFLLGVYRWQTRVTAYVLSMTDEYPPFRFN